MSDEDSCGTGMAANAILPTRMAEVAGAMAEVLTRHTESLDPDEADGRAERDAWRAIAAEHRMIAGRLEVAAGLMEAQITLPMASHDMSELTSRDALSAFENLVEAHERLREVLTEQLVEYRAMLADDEA